jgi:outer membrane protein assembly factor BamB
MKGRSIKTMNEKTNQETEKPAAKRRMRWWIPMTIVALAVANVARIRGSAELDSNFKNMQTMLTIVVSMLLLLVWFVLVVCYELATGRVIWSHTNRVRFSEPMGGDGPRATPTFKDDRVYALGATGILDCLNAATGGLIWTREALSENGLPNTYFGKSSSPLVVDDLVVVTGGMTNSSTLLAFRCNDGTPAWRAGKDQASFSSPALVTLGGRRQILSVNAASVSGHDPKDGLILWEYTWANNQWPKGAQPVVLEGDRVFLSASFNAGCVLLQVKAGADGSLSVAEVWKNRNMKSEFSNIVARGGFIYGLDDGILACVDIAMGDRKWKDGRYGHGQLILVDDLLLVQTEPGPIALLSCMARHCSSG